MIAFVYDLIVLTKRLNIIWLTILQRWTVLSHHVQSQSTGWWTEIWWVC